MIVSRLNTAVLQLDFKNAFNSIDREAVFEETRAHLPSLSAWVESSYGCQSHLIFGSAVIASCTGLHQGDPLAGHLFATTLQRILRKLGVEVPDILQAWIHDDGTICGNFDALKRLQLHR